MPKFSDSAIWLTAVCLCVSLCGAPLLAADEPSRSSSLSSNTHTDHSRSTHVQALFGIVSESDFVPALGFRYEPAFRNTNVFSLSVGRQVGDHIFHWPATLVLYAGLQRFGERGTQPDVVGGTLYVKAYKQFQFGTRNLPIRLGLGEGLSYVSRIPSVEAEDFLPRRSARLVNYLEWSVQTSLGHWLSRPAGQFSKAISDVHVGYTIFHRSTAFGLFSSSGGGVNYMGIGVELVMR